MRILGFYDADSTLAGKTRYLLRKVLGRSSCDLCDLTHGWNPLGKSVWRRFKSAAPSIEWLHRDEIPERMLREICDDIPCIAVEESDRIHPIVTTAELAGCGDNFNRLEELLNVKMQALQSLQTPATQEHLRD